MNEYRKRSNGAIYTDNQVRESVPDTALPGVLDVSTLNMLGFDPVLLAPQPTPGPGQVVVRNGVVQDAHGNWMTDWNLIDMDPELYAAQKQQAIAEFRKYVTDRVQQRLDNFAATRGYGDARTSPTVSISTYIGSVVPKFAEEAAYFRDQRDLTWAKLYEIEADVAAGKRPAPSSYEQVEAELPVLRWPGDPEPAPTQPAVVPVDPDNLPAGN